MPQENGTVHLLWTGGWDSTFRLLYVLIEQKRIVQPYYLIDADRKSTFEELHVREKIKEKLFHSHPETKELLRPTIFFDNTELPQMPDVTESYQRLRERTGIGSQYEWMARYCILKSLQGIETCIHAGERAGVALDSLAVLTETEHDRYYAIATGYQGTDEYRIFGHYHFPVYDIQKPDMEKIARERGWLDLMEHTWFCHRPIANHTPCGRCHPCGIVMKSGMAWRMPLISRMLYYATLQPFNHSNSKTYITARRVKYLIFPRRVLPHTSLSHTG